MLQSLIAIHLFPSDLSGQEVVAIFRDLALTAYTQKVRMNLLSVGSKRKIPGQPHRFRAHQDRSLGGHNTHSHTYTDTYRHT